MSNSPPHSPSHYSPPKESDQPNNPQTTTINPNSNQPADSDPCQKSSPSTPEIKNPLPDCSYIDPHKIPDQETHCGPQEPPFLVDDQEISDQEEEEEEEGIVMTMSNTVVVKKKHSSSVRKGNKRKKSCWKKNQQVAMERKVETLCKVFKGVGFVPGKMLDFGRFEEGLRRLGLWDFAHVEFDRSVRSDLVMQLVVTYNKKKSKSWVGGMIVGVSRVALGKALKLPVAQVKKGGEGEGERERFSAEFIGFLDEFVSNWMLLHGDVWFTPSEVVHWMNLVKEGWPQKVDWAGLIWYMVEKELSQGTGLKECYYASHLQQLIKAQRGDLLQESSKGGVGNEKVEEVLVEDDDDDDDGGDAKMLDFEESSLGGQKSEEQTVKVDDIVGDDVGDSGVAVVKNGDADMGEKEGDVDMGEKDGRDDVARKDGDEVMAEKDSVADVAEKDSVADVAEKDSVADVAEKDSVADVAEKDNDEDAEKVEDLNQGGNENSVENNWTVDETHKVENMEPGDHAVVEDSEEEEGNRDTDMIDYGDCRGEEQGQWLMDGRNNGGLHFLQRCSMADGKVSIEDRRANAVCEDVEDEEVEDDGHVQGFKIMQKGPMDGMSPANLMQAFEAGHLAFANAELGGQSSLELMSSRPESSMMMGGPSMFNHVGKREIDDEHDGMSHKRMRLDGQWDHKTSDFDMCIEQMMQWVGKAKMSHDAAIQEAYQRESTSEQYYARQVAEKDNVILHLRGKLDELHRRRLADISCRDKELYLMSSVIDGYRKALKDTQRAFAEYRKRCQVPDEPIYRDAGSGGVVKSFMELERERIKQEEDEKRMRCIAEETFNDHLNEYDLKWGELRDKVLSLELRLMDAGKQVKQLKDDFLNRKTSADVKDVEDGS